MFSKDDRPFRRKDSVPVSIRMEEATYIRMCRYCEEAGMTKTKAIERALEQYIDIYANGQEKIAAELGKDYERF